MRRLFLKTVLLGGYIFFLGSAIPALASHNPAEPWCTSHSFSTCATVPADCSGNMTMSCCSVSDGCNPTCTPDLPPAPICPPERTCVINEGRSCDVINSCYMPGFGTIQCDGSCDAVAPSDSLCGGSCDPDQGRSCESPNICGMSNRGTTQCDGSCSATPPSDALCSTHTIIASAGPGGSISPSGTITVVDGGNQLFNIVPRSGFRVGSVIFDGGNVGVFTGSYWLNNVRSDHTIVVNFVPTSGAFCGNGTVESGEQCDNGASSNGTCPASCSALCTRNTCAPTAALNICPDGATISTSGPPQPLTAWYTHSGDNFISCSDTTGATNRTNLATWSSSDPAKASVSNSGVRGVVTGLVSGSSVLITANYSSTSDTVAVNVLEPPCVETKTCDAAAANRCSDDAFTIAGVCGQIDCVGIRSCDYNWKEVTP